MGKTNFRSVEEASKRWISEGKIFKDSINTWLDVIYLEDKDPTDAEPKETRKDMAEYVMTQVEVYNIMNKYEKLRELFPPDNDPLFEVLDGKTSKVTKILLLPDGRIIAKTGDYHEYQQVYMIDGNNIEKINQLITFGKSHNKKYFAKAYDDRIDITEGWDGRIVTTLNYPVDYGQEVKKAYPDLQFSGDAFSGLGLQIESMNVFSDGKRVLLCTHGGIYILSEKDFQLLHPTFETIKQDMKGKEDENDDFSIFLDYPNADLSKDDKYISLGSQNSSHIIMSEENGKFRENGTVEPRSSYPHRTKFNYMIKDGDQPYPHLALSSCHFSKSATIGLPLDNLVPGFSASGYDHDETLDYIDDHNWIFSILPCCFGYYLGANNGYIWVMDYCDVHTWGYLHIGGTIMDIDISEDRSKLVVASHLGQVVVLEWGLTDDREFSWLKNNRKDPYLITNLPWIDKKRYLFLEGQDPMIW